MCGRVWEFGVRVEVVRKLGFWGLEMGFGGMVGVEMGVFWFVKGVGRVEEGF